MVDYLYYECTKWSFWGLYLTSYDFVPTVGNSVLLQRERYNAYH